MGGIGVYTTNLAKYLAKKGVRVFVASSGGEMENYLKNAGIEHFYVDIKAKFAFGPKVWMAAQKTAKFIEDKKIDIVHAQTRVAQVAAYFASRKEKIPYISTCHGFYNYKKMGRRLFPCWGNRVIAISKSVKNHLVEDFKLKEEQVALVYNGIDLCKYKEMKEKDGKLLERFNLKNKIVIGSIGRLSSVKGFKYLVEAFKLVKDKHKDAKLLIAGEGPEKGKLMRQIKKYGISESVSITPGQDEPIEKYYNLIDIFCMPSVHEGLGLSLMEAMAEGKACVASRVGGLAELIVNGTSGILVKPCSSGDLRDALLKLVEDEALRRALSANAREKAFKDFSIEDSVDKTIKVYQEVLCR